MKRPLAAVLAFYVLGILGGLFAGSWTLLLFLLALALAGCVYWWSRWAGSTLLIVALAAGYIGIGLSMAPADHNIEALAIHGREAVFAGRVVGLSTTRGGAQRADIRLYGFRDGDGLTESGARMTAIISERSFLRYEADTVYNGQFLVFSGIPRNLSHRRNPSGFDEFLFYRSRGIGYAITPQILMRGDIRRTPTVVLEEFRQNLAEVYDTALPPREAGLARSIILGDRSYLDWEIRELYRMAGLMHVLVVSGLHLSIIAMASERLLRLILPKKASTLVALGLLGLYVALTGFGVSAVRALMMYGVAALASLVQRERDSITSISLAALLLLLYQPLYLLDVGFQFSFLAVYGIALGVPVFDELFKKYPGALVGPLRIKAARSSISTTITTNLFVAPITINTFSSIYTYAVLTNAILIPPLLLVTLSGFLIGIVGLVSLEAAIFAAGPFYAMMQAYDFVARMAVAIPMAEISVGSQAWPIWGLWWLFLILLASKHKNQKPAALCGAVFACALVLSNIVPSPGIEVTFLDVGRGASTVVRNGNRAYVIDGGGNPLSQLGQNTGMRTVLPYIRHHGIGYVEAAFISHMDFDHAAGILELVEAGVVGQVFIGDTGEAPDSWLYRRLQRASRNTGTPITRISSGFELSDGGLLIEAIHPFPGHEASDNNDSSLVLRLGYGGTRILLPGDISRDAEHDIISQNADIQADILRLSRNGSAAASAPLFLETVRPSLAISGGSPSYTTMLSLDRKGISYLNVSETGAISIRLGGHPTIRTAPSR